MTDERKQRMLRQRGVSVASTMPKKSNKLMKSATPRTTTTNSGGKMLKTATPRNTTSGTGALRKKSIKKKEY